MDPDDCSVLICSLSLLFLEVKERFAVGDDLIPQDIEADDMISVHHNLICLMQNKSLQASKLKHFVVLKLSKLRKEPIFATIIPKGMRQNELETTLQKIEEVIKKCLTTEKGGFCDNNLKKIKEKVYEYKERSNTFPVYSCETSPTIVGLSQQNDFPRSNPAQSSQKKTSLESDSETQHAVEIRSSELEHTGWKSKQGIDKPQFHNNCTSSNPTQFSMSPVPEQMEREDSGGNCCSESEVTASNSTTGNSVSRSASRILTISTSLVNQDTGGLDELDNNEPESTPDSAPLSSSHSIVAPIGNKAYDNIPGTTNTAMLHCIAKCVGGSYKISNTVSPKRPLPASPEEQYCCKKKCLQNISENIWKECQNFTRKQKENYVKENVEMFPNKTAKTTNRERNRGFYRIYSLSDDTVVCKTAFCKVLGGVCSDFIDKNIDRTQTENTRVSHKVQFTHHKGTTTTEAHTQCMDLPNARSNSDTENFVTENLKSQPEASPRVNLTQSVHVEQSDQIINTGMLSRGQQQRLQPNVLNQNNQANKHEKNIQDDMELNYNAKENSHDLQPEQADDSTLVRPTNPGSKWKSRMLASESESTLNRNTPSTSNDSMAVEQLLRLSNVSGNLSIGKDSKNSENIDGQKYQNNDTTTCDKSCSSIYSSSKNGSANVEEALCSGLAQSPTDEETEDPKGMNPFLLNDTMNRSICEHDDIQTDENVLSESGRSNPTSLHGHSSDDIILSASNLKFSLSSKKDQQCCKKLCLKHVPQQVKDKCQKMTKKTKMEFVQTYVIRLPNKSTNTNRQRNRGFHHTYMLDDGRVVCKTAFCKIVGVSSDFINKNISTIQIENISQAQTHSSDPHNTNNETKSIGSVHVDTEPSVSGPQTIADIHVDQHDQVINTSNRTHSEDKCRNEKYDSQHVPDPNDDKEAENISDNNNNSKQSALITIKRLSKNIKWSQTENVSVSTNVSAHSGIAPKATPALRVSVSNDTTKSIEMKGGAVPPRQTLLLDNLFNNNINMLGYHASNTLPKFVTSQSHASNIESPSNKANGLSSNSNKIPDVVKCQTSNMPPSNNVLQSQTNYMPPSHNVLQSQSNNMPPSHNVLQSQTNNMPPSHNVLQSQSNNMPPSHNVLQSQTNNMPLSQNVLQSQTNNMPPSHKVLHCQTKNMPPSHNVLQSPTYILPPSCNVLQSPTHIMPLSHNVLQSQTNNMLLSHNVVQSQTNYMSPSHNVLQNQSNNMPLSHNMLQSQTSKIPPSHDVLQSQSKHMPLSHNVLQSQAKNMQLRQNVLQRLTRNSLVEVGNWNDNSSTLTCPPQNTNANNVTAEPFKLYDELLVEYGISSPGSPTGMISRPLTSQTLCRKVG